MNCRSAETLFSAFLDDELNQAERRDFESHLLGCRRCSQSLRELKGAMALVLDASVASAVETSPHFEDDLMVRIRSGEAMRPTVVEWLQGLLTPVRLRPFLVAGGAVCAVFVSVILFQGHTSSNLGPDVATRDAAAPPATESSNSAANSAADLSAPTPVATTPSPVLASSAPAASAAKADRAANGNGIIEVADRVVPGVRSGFDSALSNPDSQFVDEYVTDHFFLQRGPSASDPQQSTIVPVTDKTSDDVYIEF
jgi:hypothetical protein